MPYPLVQLEARRRRNRGGQLPPHRIREAMWLVSHPSKGPVNLRTIFVSTLAQTSRALQTHEIYELYHVTQGSDESHRWHIRRFSRTRTTHSEIFKNTIHLRDFWNHQ